MVHWYIMHDQQFWHIIRGVLALYMALWRSQYSLLHWQHYGSRILYSWCVVRFYCSHILLKVHSVDGI
jgi:hypothetical protein